MNTPNIYGIGNDMIEIARIRHVFERFHTRFLNRVFTPNECAYCLAFNDPVPRLATRFAGKEAVAKAMGTGIGKDLSWLDVEILNDTKGKPIVYLSPKIAKAWPSTQVMLSLSHCDTLASAVALYIA